MTRIRATSILQRISQQEARKLSANPTLLSTLLTQDQLAAVAIKGNWLENVFYGSVLEKQLVARRIQNSRLLGSMFEHVGNGGSKSVVDFIGRGRFAGLGFDLTTPGQMLTKRSKYGEGVLVPTYRR